MAAPDPGNAASVDLRLGDPRWFAADYVPGTDLFRLLPVTLEQISQANFLDRRLEADWDLAKEISAARVAVEVDAPPALLFHTAFCGSTLLARALHSPPLAVSLKEPLVLQRLALAWLQQASARRLIESRLDTAMMLLSRPWQAKGKVLIKPANQANVLLSAMLRLCPAARSLFLYSSLREFMLSCFKKLPASEQRIRWMAQALLPGTRLAKRLRIETSTSFNLVESCALAWHAQIERYTDALASDADDRIRTLDFARMLAEPEGCVRSCADWLGLDAAGLHQRVSDTFARDSKAQSRAFTAGERLDESRRSEDAYGEIIERGIAWSDRAIAPHATLPRDWKALRF
jgi:hypothetical protein